MPEFNWVWGQGGTLTPMGRPSERRTNWEKASPENNVGRLQKGQKKGWRVIISCHGTKKKTSNKAKGRNRAWGRIREHLSGTARNSGGSLLVTGRGTPPDNRRFNKAHCMAKPSSGGQSTKSELGDKADVRRKNEGTITPQAREKPRVRGLARGQKGWGRGRGGVLKICRNPGVGGRRNIQGKRVLSRNE